jgi:hypothetical protein
MVNLSSILSPVGKPSEEYLSTDGSRLLLLPYGGRVLGLFSPESNENFLWTHPDLNSNDSAQAFYQAPDWHNSGGDRTWLAPEVDIFFPDYPDTNAYRVPIEIDPGDYAVAREGGALRMASPFTVTLSRSKAEVRGRIHKSWGPAPNPLRYEPVWSELTAVTYAGYTQQTSLELLSQDASVRIGLWNLLALPHGGEMIIPTFHRARPKIYSGPIDPADLIITDHLVRFRTHGTGIQKIGVSASCSNGRLGALYPSGEKWALVVRQFAVNPSGEYIDVPWNEPVSSGDFVYSTQACRINNALGAYCELEYHAPAIGCETTPLRSDDSSQVWAFRGTRESMQQLARILISSDV